MNFSKKLLTLFLLGLLAIPAYSSTSSGNDDLDQACGKDEIVDEGKRKDMLDSIRLTAASEIALTFLLSTFTLQCPSTIGYPSTIAAMAAMVSAKIERSRGKRKRRELIAEAKERFETAIDEARGNPHLHQRASLKYQKETYEVEREYINYKKRANGIAAGLLIVAAATSAMDLAPPLTFKPDMPPCKPVSMVTAMVSSAIIGQLGGSPVAGMAAIIAMKYELINFISMNKFGRFAAYLGLAAFYSGSFLTGNDKETEYLNLRINCLESMIKQYNQHNPSETLAQVPTIAIPPPVQPESLALQPEAELPLAPSETPSTGASRTVFPPLERKVVANLANISPKLPGIIENARKLTNSTNSSRSSGTTAAMLKQAPLKVNAALLNKMKKRSRKLMLKDILKKKGKKGLKKFLAMEKKIKNRILKSSQTAPGAALKIADTKSSSGKTGNNASTSPASLRNKALSSSAKNAARGLAGKGKGGKKLALVGGKGIAQDSKLENGDFDIDFDEMGDKVNAADDMGDLENGLVSDNLKQNGPSAPKGKDIVKDRYQDLFYIISRRYIKTGLPRLFKKKSKH